MSVFEAVMLLCFGASWPFSVYKSWRTRTVQGKSGIFLALVLLGYLAGIIHKATHDFDLVLGLYVLNSLLVGADLVLWIRYRK